MKQLNNSQKKTILEITKGILGAAKDTPQGIPEGALVATFAFLGLTRENYDVFKAMLLRSDLLALDSDFGTYSITPKGNQWLAKVKK